MLRRLQFHPQGELELALRQTQAQLFPWIVAGLNLEMEQFKQQQEEVEEELHLDQQGATLLEHIQILRLQPLE
jgi:hypothetical protein